MRLCAYLPACLSVCPSACLPVCVCVCVCVSACCQVEERRRLGLVRFSLAMEDMNRLVTAAGFKEHDDDDDEHDEVTEKARRKASRARAEAEAAANAPDGGGGGLTRPRSANDVLEGVDDDDGDGRQDGKAQEKSEVKTHRPSFTNA